MIVLVRRNADGAFLFSSTQKKGLLKNEKLQLSKDLLGFMDELISSLANDLNSMAVVPVHSLGFKKTPTLGQICPRTKPSMDREKSDKPSNILKFTLSRR